MVDAMTDEEMKEIRRRQRIIWEVHKKWASTGTRRRKMTDNLTVTSTDQALHASALGETSDDIDVLHKMLEDAGVEVETRAPSRRRRESD